MESASLDPYFLLHPCVFSWHWCKGSSVTKRPEIILPENLSIAQGLLDVCAVLYSLRSSFSTWILVQEKQRKKSQAENDFSQLPKNEFYFSNHEGMVCVCVGWWVWMCVWVGVSVCIYVDRQL